MKYYTLSAFLLIVGLGLSGCTITASDSYTSRGTHFYNGYHHHTPFYRQHVVPAPVFQHHIYPKKRGFINRPFIHHRKYFRAPGSRR